jgi:hypothetical protein
MAKDLAEIDDEAVVGAMARGAAAAAAATAPRASAVGDEELSSEGATPSSHPRDASCDDSIVVSSVCGVAVVARWCAAAAAGGAVRASASMGTIAMATLGEAASGGTITSGVRGDELSYDDMFRGPVLFLDEYGCCACGAAATVGRRYCNRSRATVRMTILVLTRDIGWWM